MNQSGGLVRDAFVDLLDARLDIVRDQRDGEVSRHIPALAEVDRELFGIAMGGAHGEVMAAGDDSASFTIQSVSKPFVLALALERLGRDEVLGMVGVEPSGEAFNAISLEAGTGRPANPMQNAGAIATTALVERGCGSAAIVEGLAAFAGRPLAVSEAVYESERATGHRNRALGHLLRSHAVFDGDVDEVLSTYFRQCSLLVTVRDLARMAATLAFGGRNPVTGVQVVSAIVARDVMSIMASCGMYAYSGEWMLRVGLPAKSGISGAVLAVAPSQFGVAAYSPRLDRHGNSVRGTALVELLSRDLGLHMFEKQDGIADLRVRTRESAEALVVSVAGQLNVSGVGGVLTAVEEALASNPRVVVELRSPKRVHAAALEVLTARAQRAPDRVQVVNAAGARTAGRDLS
ncbi:glutaminase A [Microbacterium sp. A204]|uniref:glutaminase A n=1 Tax=Microbacterium sp. A204 TaxID=3457321 RepID=UPI003FD54E4C